MEKKKEKLYWAIKDFEGNFHPYYTDHTRAGAIERFVSSASGNWALYKENGWSVVKVKIVEQTPEGK